MTRFLLPRLYPILDTDSLRPFGLSEVAAAEALLEAGVQILQFRHKDVWTEETFQIAKRTQELAVEAGATFIVNDRADFAKLLGAGVHVGQNDLPPAAVRRIMRNGLVGFSTHNEEQLRLGDLEEVDYLAVGPIYETNSKRNPDPAVGTSGLGLFRPLTRKPLVAIGGVTQERAQEVIAAGADSIAVIGDLLRGGGTGPAIRARAEEWLRLLR